MEDSKPKIGRPKVPWDPFDEEIWRRLTNAEACETVTEEAKYLAAWAMSQSICTSDGKHLKYERIRDRLCKRYGGASGYKQVRSHHIQQLLDAARKPG